MKLYIEADSVAVENMSGIGHVTLELLRALNSMAKTDSSLRVTAIVPFKHRKLVKRYGLVDIKWRASPPGYKYFNYALTRTSLHLPTDLLFGKGVYIFPNYKNWPLWFSKSMTFVHDLSFIKHPETLNEKNLAYLQANVERWLKRTNRIATISESSLRDIKELLPAYANKTSKILLGVNEEVFMPRQAQEWKPVVRKYKLPEKYYLFVGNIEPRKNLGKLIEAYRALPKRISDKYGLVVVGGNSWKSEGTVQDMTNAQHDGYTIVRPSQYVPDVDLCYIYNGATALIHPAVYEGFGMTPLEAMASGTPVIVGNNSSLPEVVSDAGLYVDPQNPHDISDKIVTITDDTKLRQELIGRGRRRAETFTWSSMASRTLDICKEI